MKYDLSSFFLIYFYWVNQVFALSKKGLEAQLYEDLLYNYNKIPRPVKNSSDILLVDVGASLIRIIDVRWTDIKLQWNPAKYGGIYALHIPIMYIWSPDIVLYNNAAGDPDITIFTDAHVSNDGRVYWQPPAIYKSFCPIDVTWFPYDLQNCNMKFGAWSYTGYYVDLRQLPSESVKTVKGTDGSDVQFLENGMDLSFFYKSAEWDLLSLTSARHSVLYASCCGPEKYVDITFSFVLRRKTLFYTSNLVVPCFLISFLTTFVFYLSDHKITFSISILVTLTVFFLVLIDLMPPTSLVIPMFGRYLTTTLFLVSLSTLVSVVSVNFRYRKGNAYQMSSWIQQIFLQCLPRLLFMKRPDRKPKSLLKNDFNFKMTKSFTHRASLRSFVPAIIQPFNLPTSLIKSLSSNLPVSSRKHLKHKVYSQNCHKTSFTTLPRPSKNNSSVFMQQTSFSLLQNNNCCNHITRTQPTSIESIQIIKPEKVKTLIHSSPNLISEQKNLTNGLSYFRYPTPCGSSEKLNNSFKKDWKLPVLSSNIAEEIVSFKNENKNLNNFPIIRSPPLFFSKLNNDFYNLNNKSSNSFELMNNIQNGSATQNNIIKKSSKNFNHLESAYSNSASLNNSMDTKLPLQNALKKSKTKGKKRECYQAENIKLKVNDVIFANLLRQVRFIADHFRRNEVESEISDDWTFVAMVLDRLFLIIFSILNVATFSILVEAPSLYDWREPLNITSAHNAASKPLGAINLCRSENCAKLNKF